MLKQALILSVALAIGASAPAFAAGLGSSTQSVTAGKAPAVLVAKKHTQVAAEDSKAKKKKKKKKA